MIKFAYDKYLLFATQCQASANMVMNVFRTIGIKAEMVQLIGERARYLYYDGKLFSSSGVHVVVRAHGKIYDAMTGAAGMTWEKYRCVWLGHVKTYPKEWP